MRTLILLIVLAGIIFVGGAFYPGVGLFEQEGGSGQFMGLGAKLCKYKTFKGERTLLLKKTPGDEDAALNCPKFVLLTDERLSE